MVKPTLAQFYDTISEIDDDIAFLESENKNLNIIG
jgi:hypothetical protein